MRYTMILATAALIAAIVAIWGASIILAHPQKGADAAAAAASIDVMGMMKNAKGLPDQQFDAH